MIGMIDDASNRPIRTAQTPLLPLESPGRSGGCHCDRYGSGAPSARHVMRPSRTALLVLQLPLAADDPRDHSRAMIALNAASETNSLGSNAIVFFSGIPSDAAGAVVDSVTPIPVRPPRSRPIQAVAMPARTRRFVFVIARLQTLGSIVV
jgi:hypothetical protein